MEPPKWIIVGVAVAVVITDAVLLVCRRKKAVPHPLKTGKDEKKSISGSLRQEVIPAAF